MWIDWSSGLLLSSLARNFTGFRSGATFRTNASMGQYGSSCQYWKGDFTYMHSGMNPYMTGVGKTLFAQSQFCGQCLLVVNPDNLKSIVLVLADYCPKCSPHQLDMNDIASARLSTKGKPQNYQDLYVWRTSCSWPGEKTQFWLDRGSSQWHWYVIPYFVNQPLKEFNVVCGDEEFVGTHDYYGRWVVQFKPVCKPFQNVFINKKPFMWDGQKLVEEGSEFSNVNINIDGHLRQNYFRETSFIRGFQDETNDPSEEYQDVSG